MDWDESFFIELDDQESIDRGVAKIEESARSRGFEARAEDLRDASVEALSNAHVHAYGRGKGTAIVRLHATTTTFRLEVQDFGPGGEIAEGEGYRLMKKLVSIVDVRKAPLRGLIVHLAVVKGAA